MDIKESDILFFKRAIKLAGAAEKQNNLPIGAVICYENEIIAEGKPGIWHPRFDLTHHAEMEALRNVPDHLWEHSQDMTLYSTLEPCLMCMSAILMHDIGRVLYGTADTYGGASKVIGHMPRFYEEAMSRTEWIGPAYPEECDELFERTMILFQQYLREKRK